MKVSARACSAVTLVATFSFVSLSCYIPIPFSKSRQQPPPQPAPAQQTVPATPTAKLSEQQNISLRSLQDAIANRYRLRPDLRFVEAVGRIPLFISGKTAGSVEARFVEDHWEVAYEGAIVGTLPEFPSFADGMNLLEGWAGNRLAAQGVAFENRVPSTALAKIDDAIDGFSPYHLCEAGVKINEAWTTYGPDSRLLDAAARMYTLWAVQQLDSLGAYTGLQTRALAFLALAKASDQAPSPRYEALLAAELGYANHARAVAQVLDTDDPVRQMVSLEYTKLRERRDDSSLTPLGKFLCLESLGYSNNSQQTLEYAGRLTTKDSSMALPVTKAALASRAYVTLDQLSQALPAVSTLGFGQLVGKIPFDIHRASVGPDPLELLQKDPVVLARQMRVYEGDAGSAFTGPVLDAEAVTGFYQGCFISGLVEQGMYLLYRSVDLPSSKALADYLTQFQGTFAEMAGPWFQGLLDLKQGTRAPRAYMDVLKGLPHIGTDGLETAYDAMEGRYPYGRPENLECVEFLASRLDTRPRGRMILGDKVFTVLDDSVLLERLYTSALEEVSPANLASAAWFASYSGDRTKLHEFFAMDHATPYVKTKILGYLANLDGDNGQDLSGDYAQLIEQFSEEWVVYEAYYDYLFQRERYADARQVMRSWLDRDVQTFGLEQIYAYSNVGETYFSEGQYKKALDAIMPVNASAAFKVAGLRARALAKLGLEPEALKAGQFVVDRFPATPLALTVMLRVYWTFGHDDEATRAIIDDVNVLGYGDYRTLVWPALIETVGTSPSRLQSIGTNLIGAGLEWDGFYALISNLSKNDLPAVAIKLCRRGFEKDPGRLDVPIIAYEFFDQLDRQEEGLEWIRTTLPKRNPYAVAPTILGGKNHELLWDVYENPNAIPYGQLIWLFRAAADAYVGPENDPHYQDLVTYLNGAGNDYYLELSRILVGLSPEERAYDLPTNPDQVCETACYLGILCAHQERYEDAVRWFRTAVETRRFNNVEFSWAYDRLRLIAGENRSMARLREEGVTQY